jgi:hypothetical protein
MPLDKTTKESPDRFSLLGIIGGLMVSENLGDVHDEIFHLFDLAGIPRPEGDFEEGWTAKDWESIGHHDHDKYNDDTEQETP